MAPQTNDEKPTAVQRLGSALGEYVTSKVGSAAGKLGERVGGATHRLGDVASGGKLSQLIGAPSDDSGSNGSDSGDSSVKPGDVKVTNVVETLDVGVPLRTAYDHWTRYEKFGSFTKGVSSVDSDDETTSTWTTRIAFSSRGYDATVREQLPDDRIVWTSSGSKGTTQGAVSFHELTPTLTRIVLVVEYRPAGFFEKTGNLWRAQGRRIRLDFKHFQRYVTLSAEDPEGWRGEIRDGEVVRSDEDVRAEEEQSDDEVEDSDAEASDSDDETEPDDDT